MINIELDSHEAFLVLGPIQNAAADALIESATLRGEKSEYAEVRAKVLQRVASRIADELLGPDLRREDLIDEIALGLV